MWFQDVQSSFPSCVKGLKVPSCLVLTEAAKRGESTHRHTALTVGEFEVATGGGIWVAIGGQVELKLKTPWRDGTTQPPPKGRAREAGQDFAA